MRRTEGDRPRQRPGRSWWIRHPVEQAGTMGKRQPVPGHDRPSLGPIFGLAPRIRRAAVFAVMFR